MTIDLSHYLILAGIGFSLSLLGIIVNRKNLITLLMCVELMLLSINLNFMAFSHFLHNNAGEVFVFFILTVAAAEAAIGLAIVMLVYRNRQSIRIVETDELKG